MKSSHWVLCCVALLCLQFVRSQGYNSDEEENILNDGGSQRTEKYDDLALKLQDERKAWRDLPFPGNQIYRDGGTGEEDCNEEDIMPGCKETGGTCKKIISDDTFKCVCPGIAEYKDDIGCEVTEAQTCSGKFPKCLETGGSCTTTIEEDTMKCVCPEGASHVDDIGCKVTEDKTCTGKLPKCLETGGSCTTTKEKDTFQCVCPEGASHVDDIGCKVSDEKCNSEKPQCKTTGGDCSIDPKSKKIKCDCPKGIEYMTDVGCKDCDGKPKCRETGGKCKNPGAANAECECPEGTKYNVSDGCQVLNDTCNAEFERCLFTGGFCISKADKTVECVCPEGTRSDKKDGCKVLEKHCRDKRPLCLESGGSCISRNSKSVACSCPTGTNYDGDVGCKVEKQTCDTKKPKCLATGGICVSTTDKSINCICPKSTAYENEKEGCKVPDADCDTKRPNCLKSDGFCKSDTDGNIECVCPVKKEYSIETGCKAVNFCIDICGNNAGVKCTGDLTDKDDIKCGCKNASKLYRKTSRECLDDNCLEICGIRYGVASDALECNGDPFGDVECKCTDKSHAHDPKDKKCKTDFCKKKCESVTCIGDKFKENEVECKCGETYEDFDKAKKECKVNYCKKVCGTNPGVECDGDEYKEKKVEDCECSGSKYFDNNIKECRKQCSEDKDDTKCQNSAECVTDGELKFCECPKGTTGDFCNTITECGTRLKGCEGDRGTCIFKNGKADCKCKPESKTKYFDKVGYCEDECTEDKNCKGKKKCNKDAGVCACPDGLEGDDCGVITGCKKLKETCEKIDAKCIFKEDETDKATCKCNKENFVYDDQKCKDPFCVSNPCQTPEQCKYDAGDKTGFCECEEGQYYNYKEGRCEGLPDKCLLKKSACGKNKVCIKGKCECAEGYKEEEKKEEKKEEKEKEKECKPHLCDSDHCFSGANCKKEDGSCICIEGKFFNGRKCVDAECDWNNFKKNCTCPDGMERKEKSDDCVPSSGDACSKNCGYGLCVKDGEKEVCKCFDPFATNVNETCILKTEVCASEKVEKDFKKCDCSGKQYTRAKDDITCRLITCSEASAQKDCNSKGATCMMRWKKDGTKKPGYYCECPKGYTEENGKCSDPCSQNKNIENCMKKDQFCYNSVSKQNALVGDCACPPTLELKDGKCTKLAENVHIIRNLPVLKKRYVMKSGINKVLLNADIIVSMTTMFSEAVYGYGYLYDYKLEKDLLMCSVWINFKKNPGSELKRIKFQARKFPANTTCADCDDTVTVWPPNLMLDGDKLNKIEYDDLKFCKPEVKNAVCGNYADCKDNKCSCPKGFRTVEFTVRQEEKFTIQRCEDIDECSTNSHDCSKNTTCVNIPGDYGCQCKPGFKKNVTTPETDKTDCFDLCTPNPCRRGKCTQKGVMFDCECDPGVGGTYCHRADVNYASAKKGTVIVGAVLGTILCLAAIAFLLYYRKIRKSSGSEDFMPAPRMDNAEMTERRNMRGVVNKSYE